MLTGHDARRRSVRSSCRNGRRASTCTRAMPTCPRTSTGWCSPAQPPAPDQVVVDLARQRLADLQYIVKRTPRQRRSLPVGGSRTHVFPDQPRRLAARRALRAYRGTERERELRRRRRRSRPARRRLRPSSTLAAVQAREVCRKAKKAAAKAPKPVNDTTVTAVVKDAARPPSWGRDGRTSRGDRAHRRPAEPSPGAPDPAQQQGRDRGMRRSAGRLLTH